MALVNRLMFRILRALILILVLLSAGCGPTAAVDADAVAQSEVPQESAPEESAEHLAELAINNQRFAWDLYGALHDGEDNLLLSPLQPLPRPGNDLRGRAWRDRPAGCGVTCPSSLIP